MLIIYQPSGKAKEYADLAVNLYTGCTHCCTYCFGPATLRKTRTDFHANVAPKKDALERFGKDAQKLAEKGDDREILLSFVTDPYQPLEMKEKITREAIKILIANNLRFTILTKGGTRASRDFDLLTGYDKCSFGTTVVFESILDAYHFEPGAPSPVDRLVTIQTAKKMGIRTRVSLEPVIYPEQALNLIRAYHEYVDHWKIGKINYDAELEGRVDWLKFREDAKEILDSLGADYYFKKSLKGL